MTRRILLDCRPLQGGSNARGIGTYVRGLLSGFAEMDVLENFEALLARADDPPEVSDYGIPVAARLPEMHRRLQPQLDPFLVAAMLRSRRPRLYHATEFGQPILSRTPVVITVHDLIPFAFPGYPWKSRERLRFALSLLKRADRIIAPSQSTKADCVRIAHCDPGRITVIPEAAASFFKPANQDLVERTLQRLGISRPYLLAPATFEPHKRPEVLVEVAARVRREHDVQIVVTGKQGIFGPRIEALFADAGLSGATKFLGFVPEQDLVALYTGCAAMVFSSAYEGFGLPPLEAMACGAPVVAFQNSSLPEVIGDAGKVVPDCDVTAMSAAVAELISSAEKRTALAKAGTARAKEFSWARAARETWQVYSELMG